MDDKIKHLTDKILAEGVDKGKKQAEELIEKATRESEAKLANAEKDAEALLASAQKQVEELKRNTESELKLAANQTLQSLQSAIADTLSEKLSQLASDKISSDKDQLFALVAKIVANWTPGETVVIETSDEKALNDYFQANAKELLDKGLTIKEVAGNATTFAIKPADGSYKINFGEKELKDLFTSFIRPKLIDLLF